MVSRTARLLKDGGLTVRTEPTRTPLELRLELAAATRAEQDFSKHRALDFTDITYRILYPHELSGARRIDTKIRVDPKEILLLHRLFDESIDSLRDIRKIDFPEFLENNLIQLRQYSLVGSEEGLYVICGSGSGGNHRTFLSCERGLESVPAIVNYSVRLSRLGYVFASNDQVSSVLPANLVDDPTSHANDKTAFWIIDGDKVTRVVRLPEDKTLRDALADLMILRGSPFVAIAD